MRALFVPPKLRSASVSTAHKACNRSGYQQSRQAAWQLARRTRAAAEQSSASSNDKDAALTDDMLQQFKARFDAADHDKNGKIDLAELHALLESTSGGQELAEERWLDEEYVKRVMQQYDTDNSGFIEFNEFIRLAQDGALLEGKMHEYRAAFDAVDESRNGTISASELARLFSNLGQPVSYDKLAQIFQTYDKDESGQIEFHEFLMMFKDQLLELRAVLDYIETQPTPDVDSGKRGSLVQAAPGDVLLIFSEAELDELLERNPDKLVVLFGALTWCRSCKTVQRPLVNLAQHYSDAIFIKFYGNANESTKNLFKTRLRTRATPCFWLFKNGEIVESWTGANKFKLETNIRKHMPQDAMPPQPFYNESSPAEQTVHASVEV